MSIVTRIKSIHPGVFIAAFFFVLIAFNVAFFIIAANQDVQLVDIGETHVRPPADAGESPLAPSSGRVHR